MDHAADMDYTPCLTDDVLLRILRIAAAEQERTAFPVLSNLLPYSQRTVPDTGSDASDSSADMVSDPAASRARLAEVAGLGLVCRRWRDLLAPERAVLAPRGDFSCAEVVAFLRRHPNITKLRLNGDNPAALSGSMLAALSQVQSSLTSLQLDYGQLNSRRSETTVPPEIAHLSSLQELEVKGVVSDEVILLDTIGELQSLKSLILPCTRSYPASLAKLTGLTRLEMRNMFQGPPQFLVHLQSLEVLVLHWYSMFSEWTAAFNPQTWNMPRLKSLSLLSLYVSFQKTAFESFPHLTSLKIHPQRIPASLPPSLFQLTSLQELDVCISPSASLVQGLPQLLQDLNLKRLCLSIVRISEADDSASLRRLLIGLFGTPLESLVIDDFYDLPEDAEPWHTVSELRHLELREGRHRTVPRALVSALHSLQSFSIVRGPDQLMIADAEEGLYPKVEAISISTRLDLGIIDFNSFSGPLSCATNLKKLSISCADHFCTRSFSNHISRLTNLRHVELEWRGMLTPAFCALPSLEHLKVKSLDPEGRLGSSFRSVRHLTSLTLDLPERRNTLPDSIGNFAALRRLTIKGLCMEYLPPSLGSLSELRTLEIRMTDLKALPESLSGLGNLEELTLLAPSMSALPSSLCDLQRLKSLELNCGGLAALPEKLGALTILTSAALTVHGLQTLPTSMGRLTNLSELKVTGHDIQSLPPSLANLCRLKSLRIDAAQTALPEWLSQLSALCRLELLGWCSNLGPPEAANRRAARGLAHSLLAQMPSLEHVTMEHVGGRVVEVRVQVPRKAAGQAQGSLACEGATDESEPNEV